MLAFGWNRTRIQSICLLHFQDVPESTAGGERQGLIEAGAITVPVQEWWEKTGLEGPGLRQKPTWNRNVHLSRKPFKTGENGQMKFVK